MRLSPPIESVYSVAGSMLDEAEISARSPLHHEVSNTPPRRRAGKAADDSQSQRPMPEVVVPDIGPGYVASTDLQGTVANVFVASADIPRSLEDRICLICLSKPYTSEQGQHSRLLGSCLALVLLGGVFAWQLSLELPTQPCRLKRYCWSSWDLQTQRQMLTP